MKDSMWGYFVIVFGILTIAMIFIFQNITNTDQQNFTLLRETSEAAMYDAIDLASYQVDGTIRIDQEKFIENFIRRFAENASLSRTYQIDIYDINEEPPKVSIKVSSKESSKISDATVEFDIVNKVDAIIESKY